MCVCVFVRACVRACVCVVCVLSVHSFLPPRASSGPHNIGTYVFTTSRKTLLYNILENATALGSLIRPRAVTRCNLAVSDMYMRDFGKTHQIAYTYCSVGISDLKPLTGTSADQLPHRKSRSLATA